LLSPEDGAAGNPAFGLDNGGGATALAVGGTGATLCATVGVSKTDADGVIVVIDVGGGPIIVIGGGPLLVLVVVAPVIIVLVMLLLFVIMVGGGAKFTLRIFNPPKSIPGGNPTPPLSKASCVSRCN
jgi:hypothetical protein